MLNSSDYAKNYASTIGKSLQGARPDHVRIDSSCCFPRELVSFHPRQARSPPVGKRLEVLHVPYNNIELINLIPMNCVYLRLFWPTQLWRDEISIVFCWLFFSLPTFRSQIKLSELLPES